MPTPPPPMPPAPPSGPPPGGPPDQGGNELAQRIIAEIPEPKKGGYSPKVVQAVADQLIETWEAVSEWLPLPPPPPMEALIPPGYTGEGKLPEALVGAFTLLLTAIAETSGIDRYAVDVAELVDDRAVNKIEGLLSLLAKDKKVRKAIEEVLKAEEPDADDMGGPSDKDADNKGAPPIPKGVGAAL